MQIINLTPHPVTIGDLAFPPAGPPPRVTEEICDKATIDTPGGPVDIHQITYGAVYDLPAPEPDTLYVVSRMVAEAIPDRRDLVFPTGQVRDGSGRIIGCQALGRVAQ